MRNGEARSAMSGFETGHSQRRRQTARQRDASSRLTATEPAAHASGQRLLVCGSRQILHVQVDVIRPVFQGQPRPVALPYAANRRILPMASRGSPTRRQADAFSTMPVIIVAHGRAESCCRESRWQRHAEFTAASSRWALRRPCGGAILVEWKAGRGVAEAADDRRRTPPRQRAAVDELDPARCCWRWLPWRARHRLTPARSARSR